MSPSFRCIKSCDLTEDRYIRQKHIEPRRRLDDVQRVGGCRASGPTARYRVLYVVANRTNRRRCRPLRRLPYGDTRPYTHLLALVRTLFDTAFAVKKQTEPRKRLEQTSSSEVEDAAAPGGSARRAWLQAGTSCRQPLGPCGPVATADGERTKRCAHIFASSNCRCDSP